MPARPIAHACSLIICLGLLAGEGEAVTPPDLPEDPIQAEDIAPPPLPATEEAPPTTPTVTLAQAVMIALERNFAILGNADALQAARIGEATSRAQFYPKLTPGYSRGVSDTGEPLRVFSVDASQKLPWLGGSIEAQGLMQTLASADPLLSRTSSLRLSLTQPLLRGFGPTATFADLTRARRTREGQERAFVLAQQSLALQVASTFYQVVRQRQLLVVASQSLGRNQTLLRASEARMEVGLASKLDVYRAELQVSYAQDAAVQAETGLQTALEEFRVLLGSHPTDALEPAEVALSDEIALDLEPLPILVERALQNRLEIQESRDQVADARRSAFLARQNLLPQLDLTVNVTRIGYGPSFRQSMHTTDNQVNVLLGTSYPIERSIDLAQKAMSDLAVQASERALLQRQLNVEAEVRGAVRNLGRIVKSVELQKKGVDLAAKQHRLASLRYERGIAPNFDVIEAEDKLVSARASLVGLLTDFHIARVALLRATGVLDLEREFR